MEQTEHRIMSSLSLKAPLMDTLGLLLIAIAYLFNFVDWLVAHEPYLKVGIEVLTLVGLCWRGCTVVLRYHKRRILKSLSLSPIQKESLDERNNH